MAWRTLAEEDTLLATLAESPRVAVDTIGTSVQGRPVRLVRIGDPTPPAVTDRAMLMHIGLQHGTEEAGREALLNWAAYLTGVQTVDTMLRLTGAAGAYATTPDNAALDITGDIDLRAEIWPDEYITGSIYYLLSKYTTTGSQRSYTLRISAAGVLTLAFTSDGSTIQTRAATAALVPGPTGRLAVRATLDVDDGASQNVATFYTATTIDGPWTQLGDPVVTAGPTSIFSGSAVLEIGTHTGGTTGGWPGYVLAAEVRNGIDGTVVANPDFRAEAASTTSFADGAGRTWTVNGAAAIVDVGDPAAAGFLGDHGILLVPTVNPDGLQAGTRNNAADEDLNRDHILLGQPETQALATVLGQARPAVVVDHHETTSANNGGNDITFLHPTAPPADSGIVGEAQALIVAMKARATSETWSSGDWTGTAAENLLRNCAGLRNAAGVLVEVTGLGSGAQPDADRLAQHYAMCQEALTYAAGNDVIAESDDAAGRVAAVGAAGTTPFDLRTTVLDPPPLAYRISGVVSSLHLTSFGITTSGAIVSMAQAAQPVIPFLFDPESEFHIATASRLFVLPGPPVPAATVQELAPVVSGSHTPLFAARLLPEFQLGNNPSGDELLIVAGDVQFNGTAEIRATLELETVGISQSDAKSLFPRRSVDALAPYGTEVFVSRGVDLGGAGELWSPLGYFRINAVEQTGGPFDPIRLSCQDRMAGIVDARIVRPYFFRATRTIQHIVDLLVTEVYPDAVVLIDDDAGQQAIGQQLVVDESRYAALRDIAESLGKIMFWDGDGFLRIEAPPAQGTVMWEIKAGRNGVLIGGATSRRVSRQGMHNGVRATGEGVTANPVQAIVVDRGPNSPTRWAGRFGRVPRYYSSPLLRSNSQARVAAEALLRRSIGMPYSVNFGAVPNPALRPYDSVRITHQDGNRDKHLVEACTIPLTAGQHMTGRTREQTLVVVGTLTTGEL